MQLLLHEVNDQGHPVVVTDGVLCHLCAGVSAGDVPEGADGWLYDLTTATGIADGAQEGLHPMQLVHYSLQRGEERGEKGSERKEE